MICRESISLDDVDEMIKGGSSRSHARITIVKEGNEIDGLNIQMLFYLNYLLQEERGLL